MKLFIFIFTCVAIIDYGWCIDCYKCQNCDENRPDTWDKISCGVYGVPIPKNLIWACLTIDFTNKTTLQEEQVRKCVLAEKKQESLTFNCPINIGEIKSCKICSKDFCT
ncbi:unnamed protein product [Phyllotreta striolata]|uniref:Uncharacterized protein n=1 Tax=Phyllotreta striolata TaxID=444603 RepID=A0A9N9XLJ8_PHYSR|nr:unnamed protein product [Phyllotreta striolata]